MEDISHDSETLQDYLGFFGLDQEPFDAELFYSAADRQALLDQLNHLCHFSASLVVLMGGEGVGKSSLSRALAKSLNAEDSCLISPGFMEPCGQVLARIAREFDLPSEGGTPGQLLSEIRHFSQSAEEESRAVILIDDAHNLDDETLAALLSLLQGQEASLKHLNLVFFGAPELISSLDAIEVSDVLIHDLYLDSLDATQLEDYLAFRMLESGFVEGIHTTPFDLSTCELMVQQSGGNLHLVHQAARKRLIDASLPKTPSRSMNIPVAHVAAVVALATLLLVALYFPSGDKDKEVVVTGPEPKPSVQQASHVERSVVSHKSLATSKVLPENSVSFKNEIPPLNEADSSPGFVTQAPESSTKDAEAKQAQQALTQMADEQLPPQKEAREAPSPIKPPAKQEALFTSFEKDILSWPQSDYTLQVLGSSSASQVRDFISRQANKDELRLVTTLRDGKDWHRVFAGRYATSAQASRAIKNLPKVQRDAGPWPRGLGSVQQQLREYHSKK